MRMKRWLEANGIKAMPKYIKDGSMHRCWGCKKKEAVYLWSRSIQE